MPVGKPAPVRPPWALPEERFREVCRPAEMPDCVAACPQAILTTDDAHYPLVNFAHGECTFCHACVEACPTPVVSYSVPKLGAAGAVEAVAAVKSIETGFIHPTINYADPDPACDLDYVPNVARQAAVRTVLSNSFGFGGQNACLVFEAYVG